MFDKEKLQKIILDNIEENILIQGVTGADFRNATIINSDIASEELGLIPTEQGYIAPDWLLELQRKSAESEHNILVIDQIDKIAPIEQTKFVGLLKYKALNGAKLPDGTQILVTTTSADTAEIAPEILSLLVIA